MKVCIKQCILPVAYPQSYMGYLKSIKLVRPPSGQSYQAGVQLPMGLLRSLFKVLKSLVVKSPHHIQSTNDFVNRAKGVTLQLGECLTVYDITALFTSVPIDPALNIIKDLLQKDEKLSDRTVLSVQNIIEILGFCLHNTYFSFQNKFYEQFEGVAMGSPVSPIVANLYMEHFERKALWSASNPPGFGLGLWMTHGSFNIRLINKHLWTISIA